MLNPMMLFLWDLQPLISAAAAAGLLPLLHAAATNHKCVSFQMSDDAPAHEPLVGLAAHRLGCQIEGRVEMRQRQPFEAGSLAQKSFTRTPLISISLACDVYSLTFF